MKLERISKYFFYLFIFFAPIQGRKVFLTDWSFYTGNFTEYTSIFLYISDIFLLTSFLLLSLSIFNKKVKDKQKINKLQSNILFLIVIFSFWTIITTNHSYILLGLLKSIKIAEWACLVFLIFYFLKKEDVLVKTFYLITFSATIQSFIGIYQYISQKPFFGYGLMHKISGETLIDKNGEGIAKVLIEGEKIARSYGTMPHPNLLGGFLVFSIFISLFLYLEHKYYILSNIYKYFKIKSIKSQVIISYLFWTSILLSQITALTLTFSRSSWLALIISFFIFILIIHKNTSFVSRETNKLKKINELLLSILIFLIFIILNLNLVYDRIYQDVSNNNLETSAPQNDTFEDRDFFNNVSRETFYKKPLSGSGTNTFIFQIKDYVKNKDLASWQYQPAHNIFYLILSENGIIGLLIFISIIIYTINNSLKKIVSRETKENKKIYYITATSILIGFILISFFDHYFYTLQQGQIFFWIVIGLLFL